MVGRRLVVEPRRPQTRPGTIWLNNVMVKNKYITRHPTKALTTLMSCLMSMETWFLSSFSQTAPMASTQLEGHCSVNHT